MDQSVEAPDGLSETVRSTMAAHIAAQNAGDANAVLLNVHSKSPIYELTRQQLKQLYLNFKLQTELLVADVVGIDDDYAYMRVKQKTIKLQGPDYKNNMLDMLLVFARDGGDWKIWAQLILKVQLL